MTRGVRPRYEKRAMRIPSAVRRIEQCWIPMPDGCRLAARLWLPADAETSPVPAILEYIPYRKRDFTRARDEPMHGWFAAHGYAAVRVDVRGSGESEGILLDEYHAQEIADGSAVIAWIAAQPWCTGAVGMIGKSWGGFSALQLAARRPPALRAVVVVCASDDRYTDDAHYMGGCLLNENLTWGSMLLTFAALPPDPALAGASWRSTWLARLDHAVLFPELWLRHQRRDAYWRHGSVREELGAITCPVYAVGGWADAYANAIPRLVAGLAGPRRGLVGPWGHLYPHEGAPGAPIGFLQETLRWWDEWLAGGDTDVRDEPSYRTWMGEADGGGRWVAEVTWPSPRIASRCWALNPGRLDDTPGEERALAWRSPQSVGLAAGDWCSFGSEGDGPTDQREDDAGSLTFDSAPLGERLEILGAPVAVLDIAVDQPQAFLAVRLNEVRDDGTSVRVTYGVLNLTHRAGNERPEALEPGRRFTVRVALNHVAHAFDAGHRLRLAISTAYWPIVWPSPEPVTLRLFTGASRLELPVRPASAEHARPTPFAAPESAPPPPYTELRPPRVERRLTREEGTTVHTIVAESGGFGAAGPGRLDDIDLELGHTSMRRYQIRDADPLSASAEITQRIDLRRGAWAVRVESHVALSATRVSFELSARLEAFEGEALVRGRSWRASIPRD
jgi:putative CocE/NonD family hydrolase